LLRSNARWTIQKNITLKSGTKEGKENKEWVPEIRMKNESSNYNSFSNCQEKFHVKPVDGNQRMVT
jgi:hypothetical protein